MFTDRTALTSRAYNEQGPLAARLAIYDYQRDRVDLPGVAVAALADVRGTVLDAGCGLGTYVRRLRDERPDLDVLPLDLSAGMGPEVVGDIQALPLADGSVDAALAMHMLYHVPDIERLRASCGGWCGRAACCWRAPTRPTTRPRSASCGLRRSRT